MRRLEIQSSRGTAADQPWAAPARGGLAQMLVLIAVLTSSAILPVSVLAVDSATRQDVRSLVMEFIRAWNDDDMDRLLSLFIEDGIFITSKGRRAESQREIRRLLTRERDRLFDGTILIGAVESLEELNEDTLRVKGRYELNGYKIMGFIPATPRGRFFMTLVYRDGDLMIRRVRLVR